MRRAIVYCLAVSLAAVLPACSTSDTPAPSGPQPETVSPKDAPAPYKVLADDFDKAANAVALHVLVAPGPRHDTVDGLLRYLYRHLMTRRESQPAALAGYVYSDEVQFRTPPRSPIASVVQKSGELAPTFDNKVPLEFSQQVAEALPVRDAGWKLGRKVERDDDHKVVTVTQPYTEPGQDRWADALSFNQAMNIFTDTAQALFDRVPELRALTYVGRWKDAEVVRISLDRAQYQRVKLGDLEDRIGQLHGRAYLELSNQHGSDAEVARAHAQRTAELYKKLLAQLKGQATVSPALR